MASIDSRLARLEKKIAKLEADAQKQKKAAADLKKCCRDVQKWIRAEVKWSKQVTMMLRLIDWNALANDYSSGAGENPPQTPPDWPIKDE